jgi:ubiquinone/menaquinone biosynthesis C-methylase UbiE
MTMQTLDTEKFKAAARGQWDRHAEGWSNNSDRIRAWLRPSTEAMLAMAEIRPGARVLDVAAGAGDQTVDIAERVGPTGSVLATDLSPAILAYATARARRAGCFNVEIEASDGESLKAADATFDAVICRLGLMLFPDPAKGLREMFRTLKPGGRASTMVFSTPETNPCARILMGTAFKHAGLPPADPFQPGGLLSLGKPGLIDTLFHQAGFTRVATTRIEAPFRLPSVIDYLGFVRSSASPIGQILSGVGDDARQAAWREIEEKLSAFATPDGWEGPNELLLTVGQRP